MLKLYKDDVEIASNIPAGIAFTGVPGLYIGDPQDGYQVEVQPEAEPEQLALDADGEPIPWVPNPNWPEIGTYRFEAMEEQEPEPVPVIIPQSVTMRQAQLALYEHGYLDDVEAAIEAAGRPAQIEWKAAKDVYRDSPLALAMADILGLDDAALDALFVEASLL